MGQIQVTVVCITFNHEDYIRDALEGFIAQRTSFSFRVLVGDDCSTDGTPDIIREYALNFPDIIIPVLRQTNIGAGKNWVDLVSKAKSKYIAFCEGDDYWSDPLKLQKQFDYMERHADLRACFHDASVSIETESGTWFQANDYNNTPDGSLLWPSGNKRFHKKAVYRLENYILFGFVHTSSMFIRWDYSIEFPDWFYDHGMSDFPTWALQINTGKFGYIDQTMSIHRRTSAGAYEFKSKFDFWDKTKPGWISLDEHFIDYFKQQYDAKLISKAFSLRLRDDIAKYLKGRLECGGEKEFIQALLSLTPVIAKRLHIPPFYHNPHSACFGFYIKVLRSILPIPPYNFNIVSRAFRKVYRGLERYYLKLK